MQWPTDHHDQNLTEVVYTVNASHAFRVVNEAEVKNVIATSRLVIALRQTKYTPELLLELVGAGTD